MRRGVDCAWCGKDVRVNKDGTLRKHKRERSTSWQRGRQDYCLGGGRHWREHHRV